MGRFCFYKLLLVSVLLLLSLPHGSTGNCHNFLLRSGICFLFIFNSLFLLFIYFFWALNHHFLLIRQLSGFSRQLKESVEFEDSTVHVQVGFLIFWVFSFFVYYFIHPFSVFPLQISHYIKLFQEAGAEPREMMELMDYKDPGPNTNPKSGFMLSPPPQAH
ncbi:hypothetical protein WN944_005545 [Citrus x changshan-huyou]|uniref:Transmembrane protein n=1 Tax=Citrus x changshan-huyou TaxID=2935761 RepID=A0AAP0M2L0_9ROSI